jgi:hypothetical protein
MLGEKPEGKRPIVITRRRWKDNVKIWGVRVQTGFIWLGREQWQDFLNSVINIRFPYKAGISSYLMKL